MEMNNPASKLCDDAAVTYAWQTGSLLLFGNEQPNTIVKNAFKERNSGLLVSMRRYDQKLIQDVRPCDAREHIHSCQMT